MESNMSSGLFEEHIILEESDTSTASPDLPASDSKKILVCLSVIGCFTNVLSLIVYFRKGMRNISLVIYLIGNALFTILHLFCLTLIWFESQQLVLLKSNFLFQLLIWLTHCSGSLVTWFVATTTADNCVRECWPNLIPQYCTPSRSKGVAFALIATTSVLYAAAIWSSSPVTVEDALLSPWSGTFSQKNDLLSCVHSLMGFLLPVTVLVPSSVRLGLRLARTGVRDDSDLPKDMVLSMFVMALLLLVLFSPGHFLRLYFMIQSMINPSALEATTQYPEWSMALQYLYYSSFALNFFLFLGSWKLFRESLTRFPCVPAVSHNSNLTDRFIATEMEDKYFSIIRSANRRRVTFRSESSHTKSESV